MPIQYVAYNQAGDRVTGLLGVESPQRAQEILWEKDLIIVALKRRRQLPSLAELLPTLFGVKPLDVIVFTRELASLLESGIALVPSIRILHEQTDKRSFKDSIRSVIHSLESGDSFSRACERQSSVFPAFYTRLLQVAEETGELRKILLELVDYMEKQRTTAAKVKKALTYPAIVLVVGVGAVSLLMAFALPAMTGLFLEFGAELPLATRMLIDLSDLAQAYGMYVLAGIVALGLLAAWYIRTPRGRRRWDRLILKIPLIGKIIERSQLARLCSTMSTLLAAGIPMTETIRLTQDTIGNRVIQEGLGDVYRETLTGAGFETAIRRQRIFPPLFSQTVGIGEETGALRSNLAGLATFYEQEMDRAIARATDMIEPIVIILIGIVVGFIAVAIMSALYAIVPGIG